jgi:hypothetical protein
MQCGARQRLIAFSVIIIFALVLVLSLSSRHLRVHYHRAAIISSRHGPPSSLDEWRDWLRPDSLSWLARGRPTRDQLKLSEVKHANALVELGYFQKAVFRLQHRQVTAENARDFMALWGRGTPLDQSLWVCLSISNGTVQIHTLAVRPDDVRLWENVFADFERGTDR